VLVPAVVEGDQDVAPAEVDELAREWTVEEQIREQIGLVGGLALRQASEFFGLLFVEGDIEAFRESSVVLHKVRRDV